MSSPIGDLRLAQIILQRIRANPQRAIRFKEFMELCLYHEIYGYYSNDSVKIGKEGDFYTSSLIGTIMGEMLAEYVFQQAPSLLAPRGSLCLVEFGGGTGRLARHVMDALKSRGEEPYASTSLVLIEKSGYHRAMQRQELAEHTDRTVWMTEEEWLSEGTLEGSIVFANELLDAFPVFLLEGSNDGSVNEIWVTWNEAEECFLEKKLPLTDSRIAAYLDTEKLRLLPGQRVEVNLEADEWITRICSRLNKGKLLVIDYGDTAQELYAPHRMRGTLLGYRRHEAAERLYEYVGQQDLTAHVNFSSCMRAGEAAGCTVEFMTQREFLLQQGVLSLLRDAVQTDPFSPVAKRNRAVRQLLLSDQMSELFKVLILSKNK